MGWTIPLHVLNNFNNKTKRHLSSKHRFKRQKQTDVNATVEVDATFLETNVVKAKDFDTSGCESDLDTAGRLFKGACVPGPWSDDIDSRNKYGRWLCSACKNSKCPISSVHEDFCLQLLHDGLVDVAFTSSEQLDRFFRQPGTDSGTRNNKHEFSLLCKTGQKDSVFEYLFCHLGVVPEYVYMTAISRDTGAVEGSAKASHILGEFVRMLYSHVRANIPAHYTSDSLHFVGDEETIEIKRLDVEYSTSKQPFAQKYLIDEGAHFHGSLQHSRSICDKAKRMRLCVLSTYEYFKCVEMQSSLAAAGMRGALDCVVGKSEMHCLEMLNTSRADIAVVAAHRADRVMSQKNIVPIIDLQQQLYNPVHAVAVTVVGNGVKGLNDIKRRDLAVCSAGTDSFAGWEAPNHALKNLKIIDRHNCKLTEEWHKLFRRGCVPGAQSIAVTLGRNQSEPIPLEDSKNLCDMCNLGGAGWCKTPAQASDNDRDDFDIYYGDIGALRCLLRKKGDIAFLRDTALKALPSLQQQEDFDMRNIDLSRFLLICSDGTTSFPYSSENVAKCNLGHMPDRWIVARGSASNEVLRAWQDVLMQAQNRGREGFDWFRTYLDVMPGKTTRLLDLIFSNNTKGFSRIDIARRRNYAEYHKVLYHDWSDPFACGAPKHSLNMFCLILVIVTLHRLFCSCC